MRFGSVMVLAGLALVASGCATGKRQGQALDRLQSQVGLLDERISRLEQSSVGWSADSSASGSAMSAHAQEPIGYGSLSSSTAAPKAKSSAAASSDSPTTREVQRALKSAGFYQGTVDGKRGPATQQAVEEFQRINGLKVDGKVGPQTWAKLRAYLEVASAGSSADAGTIPLK